MGFNKNMPQRQRNRLPGFDYCSSGAYFITICTSQRQKWFAIVPLHAIVEEQWQCLSSHFPGILCDTLIVMPDHIHCLLFIDRKQACGKSLSEIIGGYKSLVSVKWSKYLHENTIDGPQKIWQSRFYDHIIRNEYDFDEKKQYMLNNDVVAKMKQSYEIYISNRESISKSREKKDNN